MKYLIRLKMIMIFLSFWHLNLTLNFLNIFFIYSDFDKKSHYSSIFYLGSFKVIFIFLLHIMFSHELGNSIRFDAHILSLKEWGHKLTYKLFMFIFFITYLSLLFLLGWLQLATIFFIIQIPLIHRN
jgi:hypothetical protein